MCISVNSNISRPRKHSNLFVVILNFYLLSFNYILAVTHIYIGYMVFQSVTLLVPERVLLLKNVTRTESSLESENLQTEKACFNAVLNWELIKKKIQNMP